MLINYPSSADPIAIIVADLASGYNAGSWNGTGIISSTAANSNYALGYADSADANNPANLPANQIKVMFTLLGDANLDGVVNGTDFSILAANFGLGVTNWDQGNFLYGSSVNGSDFSALAANFGQGDSIAATSAAASTSATTTFSTSSDSTLLDDQRANPRPAHRGHQSIGRLDK